MCWFVNLQYMYHKKIMCGYTILSDMKTLYYTICVVFPYKTLWLVIWNEFYSRVKAICRKCKDVILIYLYAKILIIWSRKIIIDWLIDWLIGVYKLNIKFNESIRLPLWNKLLSVQQKNQKKHKKFKSDLLLRKQHFCIAAKKNRWKGGDWLIEYT